MKMLIVENESKSKTIYKNFEVYLKHVFQIMFEVIKIVCTLGCAQGFILES